MTRVEEDDGGRLVRIVDRTGCVHATLTWRGDALGSLEVPGATVAGAVIEDPLLGRAHAIADATGRPATTISAIDWRRPTEIPAIAAPGALAAGAGSAIMNVLAILAARAGVPALRYAGPYPTSALWSTLARSFRTDGTEEAFTAGALGRMARLARDPIAIDFTPAPHERVAIPRGHVELRDGTVARAVIDGAGHERDGWPARLVDRDGFVDAEIAFGPAMTTRIATFTRDGNLAAGPVSVEPLASPLAGHSFRPDLREALAGLVAQLVAPPLADDARRLVAERRIRWEDLGHRATGRDGDWLLVNVAIWHANAPAGMDKAVVALAHALAPLAASIVVDAAVARMTTRR